MVKAWWLRVRASPAAVFGATVGAGLSDGTDWAMGGMGSGSTNGVVGGLTGVPFPPDPSHHLLSQSLQAAPTAELSACAQTVFLNQVTGAGQKTCLDHVTTTQTRCDYLAPVLRGILGSPSRASCFFSRCWPLQYSSRPHRVRSSASYAGV